MSFTRIKPCWSLILLFTFFICVSYGSCFYAFSINVFFRLLSFVRLLSLIFSFVKDNLVVISAKSFSLRSPPIMTRVVSNDNISLYWMILYCSQSSEVVHVSLVIIVSAEKQGQMGCHLALSRSQGLASIEIFI